MRLWSGRGVHSVERVQDASEADERVLAHLVDLGCDPGAPREVAHYLYLPQQERADSVAHILGRGGWRTAVEACEDTSFLVVARRVGPLSTPIVKETRCTLEALAAEHGGIYDGWEATTG
jgi:Regulator of ribonuclease activity B